MAGNEGKSSGDAFDGLGKRIGTVAVALGVVISLNTLVTGCTRDRIERQASFRTAVRGEEEYWLRLYSQYMEALDMPQGEKRSAKLAVVETLLEHEVPPFDEYDPWWPGGAVAGPTHRRLTEMKDRLKLLLMGKTTNDPSRAQELAWRLAEQENQRSRGEGGRVAEAEVKATEAEVAVRPPPTDFSYATRVLATGQAKGWDIDLFWCAGAGEQSNFAIAARAAQILAGLARAGTPIGGNVALGRVRLRSLPESKIAELLPQPDNLVVADSGPGEGAVAEAVLVALRGGGVADFRRANSRGAVTRYYISGFACRPGPAPAAPPAATAAPLIAAKE
ncbi:MAG TPA: hypothetical protein VF605_14230 [Allosphingosinicella sp.]|jgi:hypothetical protein